MRYVTDVKWCMAPEIRTVCKIDIVIVSAENDVHQATISPRSCTTFNLSF
jgi:hypothetical protein